MVDAIDSKSIVSDGVRVQVPWLVPLSKFRTTIIVVLFYYHNNKKLYKIKKYDKIYPKQKTITKKKKGEYYGRKIN